MLHILSTFRARPREEVNSLTNVICDLQSEMLVESVVCVGEGPKVETTDGGSTGSFTQLQENGVHKHCVLPCLLFGAETWILNTTLLQKLESFQAELAKRILRIPTYTSNNTACMALQSAVAIHANQNSHHQLSSASYSRLSDLISHSVVVSSAPLLPLMWSHSSLLVNVISSSLSSSLTTLLLYILTSSDEISNNSLKKEKTMLDYRCKECVNATPVSFAITVDTSLPWWFSYLFARGDRTPLRRYAILSHKPRLAPLNTRARGQSRRGTLCKMASLFVRHTVVRDCEKSVRNHGNLARNQRSGP